MDRDSILKTIAEVFEDVMDADPADVTAETTGDTIAEWDSLSHVRLMVAIERQFNVRFSNAEIEKLTKVGDMVDLLLAKQAG